MGNHGSKIYGREAQNIAKKLGCKVTEGANHTRVEVRHNGLLIADFGISRDRKKGNGHIPKQLFISQTEAYNLATCTLSQAEYVNILIKKGKIPKPPPTVQTENNA